jgi:hypothetical protein
MVIHGFGDQRYAGHVTERGVKVLALKLFVKFAGNQSPSGHATEKFVDFVVCQFACWHGAPPACNCFRPTIGYSLRLIKQIQQTDSCA